MVLFVVCIGLELLVKLNLYVIWFFFKMEVIIIVFLNISIVFCWVYVVRLVM